MNEAHAPEVPNELGVPSADNTNVTVSEPANTSTVEDTPTPAPAAEEAQATPETPESSDETPAADPARTLESPDEELQLPTADYLKRLHESQQLPVNEETPDIFDEYGNVDSAKFLAYQASRDQAVFERAVAAVNARNEAEAAENDAWAKVYEAYPEIKDNNLDGALRGARIQDITAGGDGDLARLAKELAAPFRNARIEAVENANKAVEEAESLETFKPSNATPPKEAPSLMTQLQDAVKNGDTETASRLRHAIRKERIYGTNK